MKFRIGILVLIMATSVLADSGAADKVQEKKDFSMICAISKIARTLNNDPQFQDKADRMLAISDLITNGVKSNEVKSVLKTVMHADPTQKLKLLKQGAKDVGLKNWHCVTLKFLF